MVLMLGYGGTKRILHCVLLLLSNRRFLSSLNNFFRWAGISLFSFVWVAGRNESETCAFELQLLFGFVWEGCDCVVVEKKKKERWKVAPTEHRHRRRG